MGRVEEVEVYETFTGSWVGGYEVADKAEAGAVPGGGDEDAFLLRRQRDGTVLPTPIPADRIRPARSGPPSG